MATKATLLLALISACGGAADRRDEPPSEDVTSSFVLPDSYKTPLPGPGGWVQIPVVDTSTLSASDFVSKYVDTGTPAILRRSADDASRYPPAVTPDWLLRNCDLDGEIQNLGEIPGDPTVGWGGFIDAEDGGGDDDDDEDGDGRTSIPLGRYLEYLSDARGRAKKTGEGEVLYYGFDYDAKCHCSALLDQMPWYTFFRDDAFLLDPGHDGYVWPSLIVGPAGSSSALHVDNSMAPFHLTLLSGRKLFRVVRLADWRKTLARKRGGSGDPPEHPPLYNRDGDSVLPADGFDDDVVREEFIRKRGCHVFNATLLPGDAIYVPTGGLHGALNLGGGGGGSRLRGGGGVPDDEAAVAVTSNLLNPAHAGQVFDEHCRRNRRSDHMLCARLASDRRLEWGVLGREGERVDPMDDGSGSVSYDFWEHALGHPGFCRKHAEAEDCPHVVERCDGRSEGQLISSGEAQDNDDEEL